jgi:hypothetical protein
VIGRTPINLSGDLANPAACVLDNDARCVVGDKRLAIRVGQYGDGAVRDRVRRKAGAVDAFAGEPDEQVTRMNIARVEADTCDCYT